MQLWKEWDNPNCPRCGGLEDARHVWVCPAPSVIPVWELSLTQLKTWVTSRGTMPGVQDAICLYLQAWHWSDSLPPVQDFCQSLVCARLLKLSLVWVGKLSLKAVLHATGRPFSTNIMNGSVLIARVGDGCQCLFGSYGK
jgi:hypothetical protein